MQIFQEVSSVQDRTLSAGLITNRRAIESNVLVDDGQIVVLGGLIEERVEGDRQSVPGLSEIPVLGQLFRYDARRRVKTNLLVFLRPVIVRDTSGAAGVTADRYDYVRQLQGDSRLPPHWLLPDFPPSQLPQMPALPPGVAPAAPRTPASMSPDIDNAVRREAPIVPSRPSGELPPIAPAPASQ
jgi:general secretion pathway protein D